MNPDQRKNLEAMVDALGKSMGHAWSYFYVLKGFHEGAKASPAVAHRFSWLLEEIWRGLFDAFFAKAGTLVDATSSTYSLPNLITLVRRYGDSELKGLLRQRHVYRTRQGPSQRSRIGGMRKLPIGLHGVMKIRSTWKTR